MIMAMNEKEREKEKRVGGSTERRNEGIYEPEKGENEKTNESYES